MAQSLGKELGDVVLLIENHEVQTFYVCGIYQDVTSGGRTAKAVHDFIGTEAEKYDFLIDVNAAKIGEQQIEGWRQVLGKGVSIEYMEGFRLRQ